MKKTIAIVPLRNDSKGLPGKNIREFCGKPLFYRTVEQGLKVADECIVSTDIEDILMGLLPIPNGVKLRKRDKNLASDTASMESVIQDVLINIDFKDSTIILLQATSPLRTYKDIQSALNLFSSQKFDIVFSVCRSNSSILKNGFLEGNKFSAISKLEYLFQNRQQLPETYKPNGAVYVFKGEHFLNNNGFKFQSPGSVVMPEERSLDIDTIRDFKKAEQIFSKYIKKFDSDKILDDGL